MGVEVGRAVGGIRVAVGGIGVTVGVEVAHALSSKLNATMVISFCSLWRLIGLFLLTLGDRTQFVAGRGCRIAAELSFP